MKVTNELLGIGIYTPAEAGLYARVPTQTVTRWLFGTSKSSPVIERQLRGREQDRIVTFQDFVQTMAVRAIRVQYRVSLQHIRDVVRQTERTLGIKHPFSVRHKTYFFNGELILEIGDHYVQATGQFKHNFMLKEVVEMYMMDMHFGKSGEADAYTPLTWGGRSVVLNPHIRFGEPMVHGSGYSAQTLYEAVQAEGSIERAAQAYGVDERDIQLACRYFDFLYGRAS